LRGITRVPDLDNPDTRDKTAQPRLSEIQRSAENEDGDANAALTTTNRNSHAIANDRNQDTPIQHPWELTTDTRPKSRLPSNYTSASKGELLQASHRKAAKNEHIELQEGPNGERILVRGGVDSTKDVERRPKQTPYEDWPSYDDDD
jgi:hypothetical protein